MELKQIVTLSDNLKKFIQSGTYESYILDLMNQSKVIFPNRYERNPIQSFGECDFFDSVTGEKFEAKLPFDKKEGELICRKDSELKNWLKFMMDEEAEFGEKIIVNRGKYQVADLRLYKTLEKRLHTVQEDENAIILFPYPIALDLEPVDGCLNIIGMTGDILSSIFSQLVRNNIVGKRKVYVIYPSMDEKIVLRCLNTGVREYLVFDKLKEVFAYSFALLENDKH